MKYGIERFLYGLYSSTIARYRTYIILYALDWAWLCTRQIACVGSGFTCLRDTSLDVTWGCKTFKRSQKKDARHPSAQGANRWVSCWYKAFKSQARVFSYSFANCLGPTLCLETLLPIPQISWTCPTVAGILFFVLFEIVVFSFILRLLAMLKKLFYAVRKILLPPLSFLLLLANVSMFPGKTRIYWIYNQKIYIIE